MSNKERQERQQPRREGGSNNKRLAVTGEKSTEHREKASRKRALALEASLWGSRPHHYSDMVVWQHYESFEVAPHPP